MIHDRLAATLMCAVLLAALPLSAAAQEEDASPEGVDWTLTSYLDEESAETVAVPFGVEATLLLQEGMAAGSGGCNQFTGSYEIDGSSLRFSEEMSVTLALCEGEAQAVEDAYLAALGEVDGWSIDLDRLELSDDFGEVILTFEVPHIRWTTSQMTGLMAMLGGLQQTVTELSAVEDDGIDVARLRDRIKALEADNKRLKKRVDTLEKQPKATPKPTAKPDGAASFSKAERILLEGIPTRIATRCAPLRSDLPTGARAAVTCQPNTISVASVDYYLMEGQRAANEFGAQMTLANVQEATAEDRTCAQGVKSQRYRLTEGWQAEGCFRADGKAEVRFIDNATDCRQLNVVGRKLKNPAVLIELQGTGRDMGEVHAWATKDLDDNPGQLTSITKPIKRPKAARSPSCPT